MKFTTNSDELLAELNKSANLVTSNSLVTIVENYLFELIDNRLKITATNLDMYIISELEVTGTENGILAVPHRLFLEILKSIPEQPIQLEVDDDLIVHITSSSGNYKCKGIESVGFPQLDLPTFDNMTTILSNILKKGIEKTSYAVSQEELRKGLLGVNIELIPSNKEIKFVATDGQRLAIYSHMGQNIQEEKTFTLIKKTLHVLSTALPSDVEVQLQFVDNNVWMKYDNTKIFCRIISYPFPNYQSVIPLDNVNKITINRKNLLDAIKRISLFFDKATSMITCNIEDNSMTLQGENPSFYSEGKEILNCSYNGEPLKLCLNARFVMEGINSFNNEDVLMTISSEKRPFLLYPAIETEDEKQLVLIVPFV